MCPLRTMAWPTRGESTSQGRNVVPCDAVNMKSALQVQEAILLLVIVQNSVDLLFW